MQPTSTSPLSAPHVSPDTSASKISVVTADGRVEKLPATAILPIPQLASYFPTTVFIIPSFANTLVGVRLICDADCTLVFTKQDVTVFSLKVKPILTCWKENKLPRLWLLALKPTEDFLIHHTSKSQKTSSVHSAQDLPSVEAPGQYMHAASELPVKSTWLKAIKKGDF